VDTGSPGTALLSLSAVWQAEADTDIEFLRVRGKATRIGRPPGPNGTESSRPSLGVPLKGRYVQARACLFTDGPAAVSPRLSRLALTVREDLPRAAADQGAGRRRGRRRYPELVARS
jgi:hypothetical protein